MRQHIMVFDSCFNAEIRKDPVIHYFLKNYQRRSIVDDFPIKRNVINKIVFFSCLLCSLSVSAVQQGYIEAIQADVDEFSSGSFQPPAGSSWLGADAVESGGSLNRTVSLEAFSEYLQKESPGTYIFYKKIPLVVRKKVLIEYVEIGDFERTKKSIFRYASSYRTY